MGKRGRVEAIVDQVYRMKGFNSLHLMNNIYRYIKYNLSLYIYMYLHDILID